MCCVAADYHLLFTIYSYDVPENKCADCRNSSSEEFGCCDNHLVENGTQCSASPRNCKIEMSVCSIGLGRSVTQCPDGTSMYRRKPVPESPFNPPISLSRNGTNWVCTLIHNKANWLTANYSILNLKFSLPQFESHFHIILHNFDLNNGTYELIDRLSVNLTIGTKISRRVLSCQFGLATIELEVSLVCTGNFYGSYCHRVCNSPPCPCDPGFTGEFCATNIDECASVDCSGRGVCSDGVNSYTCTCQDGYRGANCEGLR